MQIIAFLLFVVAVILIFSIKDTVNKTAKWTLFGTLLGFAVLAFVYENYMSDLEDTKRVIINNFEQGKNITCNEMQVNQKRFNFENGTQSFVAKKEFKDLAGIIIPISHCKK